MRINYLGIQCESLSEGTENKRYDGLSLVAYIRGGLRISRFGEDEVLSVRELSSLSSFCLGCHLQISVAIASVA